MTDVLEQLIQWKRKAEALDKLEHDVCRNGALILHANGYPEGQRLRGLAINKGITSATRDWPSPEPQS